MKPEKAQSYAPRRRDIALGHLIHLVRRDLKPHVWRYLFTAAAFSLGLIGNMRTGHWEGVRALSSGHLGAAVHRLLEDINSTMALIVPQIPRSYDPNMAEELLVARLVMPLAAFWLSLGALTAAIRRPLRLFRLQESGDHVVIIGGSPRAPIMAKSLKAAGETVLLVQAAKDKAAQDSLAEAGVDFLAADPALDLTMARIALAKARSVIIATGGTLDNLRSAKVVASFIRANRPAGKSPVTLSLEVGSDAARPVLAPALRGLRQEGVEFALIDFAGNAVRSLARRLSPHLTVTGRSGALLMIGVDGLARRLIVSLFRLAPPTLSLTVLCSDPEGERNRIIEEFPGLAKFTGLRFLEAPPKPAFVEKGEVRKSLPPSVWDAIIVCAGGEEENFAIALAIRGCANMRLNAAPIYYQSADHASFFALADLAGDSVDFSRIIAFGSVEEECDAEALLGARQDRRARHIHASYLAEAKASGQAASAGGLADWGGLDETYRDACRDQADHLEVKLGLLGAVAAPLDRYPTLTGLQRDDMAGLPDLDVLAAAEHWRWCVDRWLAGFEKGERRDLARRTHPGLVPWDQLSEPERDKDRSTVLALPALMDLEGARMIRRRDYRPSRDLPPPQAIAACLEAAARDGSAARLVLPLAGAADWPLIAAAIDSGTGYNLELFQSYAELRSLIGGADLSLAFAKAENVVLAPPLREWLEASVEWVGALSWETAERLAGEEPRSSLGKDRHNF